MKRWAWNIFCALSLGVFVGSVSLWVRSYAVCDTVMWTRTRMDSIQKPMWGRQTIFTIRCSRGALGTLREHTESAEYPVASEGWNYDASRPFSPPDWYTKVLTALDLRLAGAHLHFAVFTYPGQSWESVKILVLPLWVFLPAGIPPFLWWRKRRKLGGRGFAVQLDAPQNTPRLTS